MRATSPFLPGLLLALLGAALLGGCASPEAAPEPAAEEPPLVSLDPAVLAEGTFAWHETSGSNPFEYYELASQAVAHPCVWDGSGGEEPYFNNRELPVDDSGLGAWSGNVSFTLDWTETDWVGSALRIAYQAPGVEGWEETEPVERGSTLVEPIKVQPRNATQAEGEDAGDDAATSWSVWVCLPSDTLEPEEPFVGSFTAKVVFAPDPVPEDELAALGGAGRTARGGQAPTQPAL